MRMLQDLQAAKEEARQAALQKEASHNAAREDAERRARAAEEAVVAAQEALRHAMAQPVSWAEQGRAGLGWA